MDFRRIHSENCYKQVAEIIDSRTNELVDMLKPFVDCTDEYGVFVCRIVNILGKIKPQSALDAVTRDLLADAFDSLFEGRRSLVSGRVNVAFPVVRRAFESISLMVACHVSPDVLRDWNKGKKISNGRVRAVLDEHPLGEKKANTNEMYDFFCLGTHPNRSLIAHRFLGDGNEFTLGAIAVPNVQLTLYVCSKVLSLWFWLAAFIGLVYTKTVVPMDSTFDKEYFELQRRAQETIEWIRVNFEHAVKTETMGTPPEEYTC